MADVSVTGAGALEALHKRLGEAMPKQARQAVSLGVREAVQRTQKKGLSIAKKRYAFSKYGKARIDGVLASKSIGPDKLFGEVRFQGRPGVPLRWFQSVPTRPSSGKMPRLKGKTVRVRIVRGGAMKERRGKHGERVFWWRSPQGNILLAYRVGAGRGKISTEDLMGASPIQAIQKHENFESIGEYLQETFAKRVNHQLSRIGM